MKTKHYTDKETLSVYGYRSDEEAKKYNGDYENLELMSVELFEEFKNQPLGGKWSLEGWDIDGELASKLKSEQLLIESRSLLAEKKQVESDIELANLLDDISLLEESQARLIEINARIAEIKDELKSL